MTRSLALVAQPRCTPFTLDTASKMRVNVPQRQMLPSSPCRICSGVGIGMLLEQADAGHDEARRAEAAHQRVLVAERLLHRMQRVAVGQPVDVADLLALDFDRQRRAGIHGAAVDEHRAGAAGAAIAAALVAGQVGAHAQRIQQRDARLDASASTARPLTVSRTGTSPGPTACRSCLGVRICRGDHRGGEADDAGRLEEVAPAEVDAVWRIVFRSHAGPLRLEVKAFAAG